MDREEQFDSFYLETRGPLLLQTSVLVDDLSAAHVAVRETYAAAWQQWQKVSTLEDPLGWVRSRTWRLAVRRSHARLWRRNPANLTADRGKARSALAHLPRDQRGALVLTYLAGLAPAAAASELGMRRAEFEEVNRTARDRFASRLDLDPTGIEAVLTSLGSGLREDALPGAPTMRRNGTRRRYTQTAAAAAVVIVVGTSSGALVYQPPETSTRSTAAEVPAVVDQVPAKEPAKPEQTIPTPDELLDTDQIARLGLDQEWRTNSTDDNTSGTGINTPCQSSRFADPGGVTALVRKYAAEEGPPRRSAVQTIEVSKSAGQARRAFDTTVGWYAGCQVGRLQLLTAYRVGNIGDQAQVLMVRVWKKPVTTYSVAVARTGRFVTSTVAETVGGRAAPTPQIVQSLADAVSMLCSMGGSADCSPAPTFAVVPPPPSGEERGILAVADLPPVGRVNEPWVGTDARPARVNPSATICDRADFAGEGARRTRARTFLVPDAKLPDRFGLSETYGVFGSFADAGKFLGEVRVRMNRCENRNRAVLVSEPRSVHRQGLSTDSTLWNLRTKLSQDETVLFRVAFVRVGRTVAQVTFSPTQRRDISRSAFDALVVRTANRLRELGGTPPVGSKR